MTAKNLFRFFSFGQRRCLTTEAMKVNSSLVSVDPQMMKIIESEKLRLQKSICLIPSENFAPRYILDTLGSVMTNKYSEGYPNARYYGGNEFIDMAELLCMERAREAYKLDASEWGINVQTLSGCAANFCVYTALLNPHDRLMGLDLPHGGHLSHGFQSPSRKVSAVSSYFESMPYRLNESTGLIDYEELEKFANRFRPKLLIAGFSAYTRDLDFARFRSIADQIGATFLVDMSHVSGLVAGGVSPSPFDFADVVTSTTHKSLRGPRGAIIFFRRGQKSVDKKTGQPIMYDLELKINSAVFPGMQGGPHNHTIAAIAVALKEASTPEFAAYQQEVVSNAKAMGEELVKRGFELVSGGTDNHMVLVDLRSKGLSGAKCEKICEAVDITINKNTIPSDKSAMNPSGIRLGTPAMTTRGFGEAEFRQVAAFLDEAVNLGIDVQKSTGKRLLDFEEYIRNARVPSITGLRKDINDFATSFPTVGY